MQVRRRDRPCPPLRPNLVRLPTGTSAAWGGRGRVSSSGPDVLVAPITELGARSRHVYLPAGANWPGTPATGAVLSGGEVHFVEGSASNGFPVFAREGAGNRPHSYLSAEAMSAIRVEDVHKTYANGFRRKVRGVDLTAAGRRVSSCSSARQGAGRRRCCAMIAGLETVSSGRIVIGDADVTNVPPQLRDVRDGLSGLRAVSAT